MFFKYAANAIAVCVLMLLVVPVAKEVRTIVVWAAELAGQTTNVYLVNGCIVLAAGFAYTGFCRLLTRKSE